VPARIARETSISWGWKWVKRNGHVIGGDVLIVDWVAEPDKVTVDAVEDSILVR